MSATEVIATDRVRLQAIDTTHLPMLWQLTQDPVTALRWRNGGASVSPEEFAHTFWDGVQVQHLAVAHDTNEPVAWLICYDANHRNRRAYLAVVAFPNYSTSRALRDAIHLFVDYVFATWPIHQLLVDVPEFNLSKVEAAITRVGSKVASLPDYIYTMDRWWSLDTFSIRRDARLDGARAGIQRRSAATRVSAGPFEFEVVT
jgi:hypothetical protein